MKRLTKLIYCAVLSLILLLGCEKITNTSVGTNYLEDISVSENSRYAISWSWTQGTNLCSNFTCGVYVRAYDSSGSPISNDIQVSPTTNGKYGTNAVGIDNTGNFVVAYEDYVYNSSNNNLSHKIYMQRYNNLGNPIGSRIFVDYGIDPQISMTSNGLFLIKYTYYTYPPGLDNKLYVKRYSITGTQIGSRILVHNEPTYTSPVGASLTTKCNGEFAVLYSTGQSAYIKQYFANGSQKGSQILVNSGRTLFSHQSIIYNSRGEICIVYGKPTGGNSNPFLNSYFLKRFEANGNIIGTENLWDNTIAQRPSISSNACGDYVITFKKLGTNDSIVLRPYSSTNIPEPEIRVNTTSITNANGRVDPLVGMSSLSAITAWDDWKNNTTNRNIYHKENFIPSIMNSKVTDTIKVCRYTCRDGCTNRSIIGNPAIPGYTYLWSPSTNLDNVNIAQPTVSHPGNTASSPNFTITYTLQTQLANSSCCYKTKDVVVIFEEGCK
tara:strand:+ start:61 stop:1545 length:1485 start_codon:yes stop_codon:yes gene_type:complete